jgi:CO/xanthine dehydrogenase FAD-binding subunit
MVAPSRSGGRTLREGSPPFDYVAPTTLSEAVRLLRDRGDMARPFAGATDLLVQVRNGRFDVDLLVDLKKIPELNVLSFDPQAGLTIGAAVPCYRIYEDPQVQAKYPGMIDPVSIIGGIGIQGRATVGGNLCNSSPSGDSIPALIVHGATCNITGPDGSRSVPVADFCTGPGRNVLASGEILVSVTIPPSPARFGAHYLRFIPRNEMDIAVVGAGASVVLSEDLSTIQEAHVALAAVAPVPLNVPAAGEALRGKTISDEAIDAAAEAARQAARPISDMRGTAEQRRHLVGVLTRRALRGAIERAKGGNVRGH